MWNEDRVLLVDPALVQTVLIKPSIFGKRNLPGYSLLRLVLGNGLITLDGEEHTHHRKLINPAFKVRYHVLTFHLVHHS
jgi:cytochrome P450